MKIALIGPTYPYRGGIAHYTTLLCRALREEHEVEFVSFSRQYPRTLFPGRADHDPSADPLQADGVHYLIDSLRPKTWDRAVRFLSEFAPQKVVFPWWVSFWTPQFLYVIWTLRRKLDVEICFICHNLVDHERGFLSRFCSRLVLGRADRVITHADSTTQDLRRLLSDSVDVVTAAHPVYRHWHAQMPTREAARARLGLKSPVILFFGFVRPYKGVDDLLAAMPPVVREHDAHLVVAGEFWNDQAPRYGARIEALGLSEHVALVDRYIPDEDVPAYFAAADLVVLPYVSGTGSGVCQLALGMHRPVVGTRISSMLGTIEDGVNGRLVEPGNVEQLADVLCESLTEPCLERLTRGAEDTDSMFSWRNLARVVASD